MTDTIKQIGPPAACDGAACDGAAHAPARIERTIDRATLRARTDSADVPPGPPAPRARRRHRPSDATAEATDDAALVEALPAPVFLYDAEAPNPKITRPEDLAVIEALLRARAQIGGAAAAAQR